MRGDGVRCIRDRVEARDPDNIRLVKRDVGPKRTESSERLTFLPVGFGLRFTVGLFLWCTL